MHSFTSEFAARSSKLQREQLKRQKQAQRRAEREKRAAAKAAKQQREVAEAVAKRRALEQQRQAEREAEERRKAKKILERTAGITFKVLLEAYKLNGTDAETGDKVCLPPSALRMLTQTQDALQHGAMFFQLSTREGGFTHCGVKDFSAPEGKIGLPSKVIESMAAVVETSGGMGQTITVEYVRLPLVTFVKLQPRRGDFANASDSAWGGVRTVLETALQTHSTMTVGDLLRVDVPTEVGETRTFELEVLELKPKSAGSLIDTDVELEICSSKVAEIREKREEARKEREKEKEKVAALLLQEAEGKMNANGDEPFGDEVVTCMIRYNTGSASRNFLPESKLSHLFDWANFIWLGLGCSGQFVLKQRYPRRILTADREAGKTFQEIGLTGGGREAFMIEASNVDLNTLPPHPPEI